MAVMLREKRIIEGKEFDDVKVFKSDAAFITAEDERKANDLDKYITKLFDALRREVKKNKLIELKRKTGVIKLWYYVGKRLKVLDDPTILEPTDKKFIWKALWQYAGTLAPGEISSRGGTHRDHFYYCYKLADYEEEFVLAAGNWRAWQDFFDSPILSNNIVLEWFEEKIPEIRSMKMHDWLRILIKLIRNEFQKIDMSFLSKKEIRLKLDRILREFERGTKQTTSKYRTHHLQG